MPVAIDGQVRKTYGISADRATTEEYTTTSGVHLTMEKNKLVTMTSPNRRPGDPGYYEEPIGYRYRSPTPGGGACQAW